MSDQRPQGANTAVPSGHRSRINAKIRAMPDPGKCYISALPDEILIHVLANLDGDDMRAVGAVCRRWRRIIADDSCWRVAFLNFFGAFPLRRLAEDSWRKEYSKRTRLLRDYNKGGRHIVQFDARIGRLDAIHVVFEDGQRRMNCASHERGMIVQCHPTTGRVIKGTVYAYENRLAGPVSSILLDANRAVFGYDTGTVCFANDIRNVGRVSTARFLGAHQGAVSCLSWMPGMSPAFVSGANDGTLRIWDIPSARCVTTLTIPGSSSAITALTVGRKGLLLAGTVSGTVAIWDLNTNTGASIEASSTTSPPVVVPPLRQSGRVLRILQRPGDGYAIVVCETSICQINTQDGSIMAILTGGHQADISCAAWDTSGPNDGKRTPVIATGDALGLVCLWDLQEVNGTSPASVRPSRVISAHRCLVTAVQVDAFKIVTGAADGSAKVLDSVTGRCIKTLNVKRLRGGNDGLHATGSYNDARAVRCIWTNQDHIIITSGEHIKSLSFTQGSASGSGKKGDHRSAPPSRQGKRQRQGFNEARRQLLEIRDEVQYTLSEREYEREAESYGRRSAARYNGFSGDGSDPRSLGNALTEEELLTLAMQMSLDDVAQGEHDDALAEALERSLIDSTVQVDDSTRSDSMSDKEPVESDNVLGSNLGSSLDSDTCSASGGSMGAPNRRGSFLLQYGTSAGSNSSDTSLRRSSAWESAVSPRHSVASEDDELMYVLELSKLEK
ncbi:hypothetical protein HDU85_002366 [Gaertneriomyces sp. JEL0708]|nr:hypothetical protein HDU85_002366 [Gaertneriomyces sp. JEL0708]